MAARRRCVAQGALGAGTSARLLDHTDASPERAVCVAGPSWCMQHGRKHGRAKSMCARGRAGT
eukprot:15243073-Alexandrium_andersonii.AAC.1